jgi:UDP-N-acetylglucosamine transferase subunit ALG13
MIFLTVGTQFGFDRLVKAVDNAIKQGIVQDKVVAQIGPGKYLPSSMDYTISLEKNAFDLTLNSCDAIISHAGMGNIELAMKTQKPLLVLPRMKKYGEVVNNHQVDTAQKFEQFGHILVAYDEEELVEKMKLLKTFTPKPRMPNRQGVVDRVSQYIQMLSKKTENNT